MKGRVRLSTRTPAATGIAAAAIWPTSFGKADSPRTSSTTPTAAIAIAPSKIERLSPSLGSQIQPAASTATRIASPERRGIGLRCRPRGFGRAIAPPRRAGRVRLLELRDGAERPRDQRRGVAWVEDPDRRCALAQLQRRRIGEDLE